MSRTYSVTREKMVEEAKRRGWSIAYFGPDDFFYEIITTDGRHSLFRGSSPQTAPWIGGYICKHKLYSLEYLEHIGITPPPFSLFADDVSAQKFLQDHSRIVVKPENSEQSKGVTVDITDMAALREAVATAREFSSQIILQKQLEGQLYRLLTVGGTFCAAAVRTAPFIIGDGQRTILALIDEKNGHPLRGEASTSPLKTIKVTEVALYLASKGQSLEDIPMLDEQVTLGPIASVSAGGEAADITDQVHQDYIDIAERISQSLGLVTCGFDLMVADISKPLEGSFPMLEMNSTPGLKIHYYPTAGGQPRNVAAAILDAAFPEQFVTSGNRPQKMVR
ncbi:MAG TPA: hypothetical protein VJR27_05680 [Candidatus Saccharimonadales bacterium]|nr:hypothetical protein [Candidatus Saccharimonadales bacterium]